MSGKGSAFVATVPVLSIGGSDLSAKWYDALVELRVELEFRVPGRAMLRFADKGYALTQTGKVKLGAAVVIGGLRSGQSSSDVLLKGEITGVQLEQSMTSNELIVVVHDRGERLTRGATVGTYVNMSIGDVVTAIASRHGLTASVKDARAKQEYLLQVDSDLALLDALADRSGHDWWVDGTTLHFEKPSSAGRGPKLELALGKNLTRFNVRASGLHADKVQVEGWDRKRQQGFTSTSKTSDGRIKPGPAMFDAFVAPGKVLTSPGTLVASRVIAQTAEEGQLAADGIRDRLVAGSVTATGTVLHGSQLVPGSKVDVTQAGPTSGTYHVSKVEHVFRVQFETRFTAGDHRPTSLVSSLTQAAAPTTPLQHQGLLVGTVTNINDPAKSGRVKVTYPGVAQKDESAWARVLSLGAGAARGLVVLPEVGDEVLMGFESGDLRQPVVLGGLFGDKSKIPLWDVHEGKVTSRRLVSRLGHVVELKDGTAPADQHVLLALADKKTHVRLGKDACEIAVPGGVPFAIKVGTNASLSFDAGGSLKIKAVNVSIEASGSIQTTSSAPTKIVSKSALNLEGQMVGVKGSIVQVQSSGPATIKGMPVMIN